jgi:hypothetical protein
MACGTPIHTESPSEYNSLFLYSSALKGPAPITLARHNLIATNDPLVQLRQFGTLDKFLAKRVVFNTLRLLPCIPPSMIPQPYCRRIHRALEPGRFDPSPSYIPQITDVTRVAVQFAFYRV